MHARSLWLLAFGLITMGVIPGRVSGAGADMPKLRVRTSGPNANRLIEDATGKPFFMAGCCPQSMVNAIPTNGMNAYFKARREQGFNMAWVYVSAFVHDQSKQNPTVVVDYAGNYMLLDRSTPNVMPSNLNPG